MNKTYTNIYPICNLYKKNSKKSPLVTQIIYGQKFSIIKEGNDWLKIKILEDNYHGYIERKKISNYLEPTHKVFKLKSNIYKFPNSIRKIKELPFGSRVKKVKSTSNFIQFKLGWIKKSDLKPIGFTQKNIFSKIKIFKNIKYKWGGKSYRGIDCSGLIQIFFNFNNQFFPRDTKDQIKFLKRSTNLKNIKKNDIIFWKGHVALVLTKKRLIHAYGPLKKTVIMNIEQTISRIKKTANLKVLSIKRI
ncbi:MAG: multi-domain protein [Candidatus Pelagibacter sp.]|nr:multi-domain protein [Candidatus Pelagibacter sp.]|tara:strand:+ start:6623 stop:7363 length:741 start_codon:yes stop_codon:yes gene_type:complete